VSVAGSCVSATEWVAGFSAAWLEEGGVVAFWASDSCNSIPKSVVGSCVSATGWVAGFCVSATLFETNDVWASGSCNSMSKSAAGSCVSAVAVSCVSAMAGSCVSTTEWVAGSCVSATLCETDGVTVPWASGSCVSVPIVEKGKDPGIGEVGGVRGISRIGGESRVVVIKGGLIEPLVRFLRKKGGKGGICFRFREGLSLMMGQATFSGSESSLRI
jgi:hypothetical protein